MRKALSLFFTVMLVCCLTVPAFAYNTSVTYDAETEPPHVITLDPNGGRVNPTQIILNADGAAGTLPTPTRGGYKFLGWYTDKTFTTEFTKETLVDKNVTVYAKWQYRGGGYVPPQSSTDTVESPKTFDSGIALYGAMALLSAFSGAVLVMDKKKHAE